FFFYFFVTGLRRVATDLCRSTWSKNFVCYGIPFAIVLISLKSTASYSYVYLRWPVTTEGPYTETSQKMFDYLKNNTSANRTVGFWKPRVMLLYSGRNGIVASSPAE